MLCHARCCLVACDHFGNRSVTRCHALGNPGICKSTFAQMYTEEALARCFLQGDLSCTAATRQAVLIRTVTCALVANEAASALLRQMRLCTLRGIAC